MLLWAQVGPGPPPLRPPMERGPLPVFDLIKGKRVHQFQRRRREMTAHKLKVSISAGTGGDLLIINIEHNSVCHVTRLEALLSFLLYTQPDCQRLRAGGQREISGNIYESYRFILKTFLQKNNIYC